MKIISWNVAGLRSIVKKGFEEFLKNEKPDIMCIQESKVTEDQLDFDVTYGYNFYLNSAERKGYSGTAVWSREKPISVKYEKLGIDDMDSEGRLIVLEYKSLFLVNCYTPNSKRELERLKQRVIWEEKIRKYLKNLEEKKPVILCGDLNVAHEEIDIKNPKTNHHSAGFTDEEREEMTKLLNSGFIDTYRMFNPEKKDAYTWWSYMGNARAKNVGWRIDYFIVSNCLKEKLLNSSIYCDVYGSDHCPIGLEIEV